MVRIILCILLSSPLFLKAQVELLVGVDAKICEEFYKNAGMNTDMAMHISGPASLLAENGQYEIHTKFDEQGIALKAYVTSKDLAAFDQLVKQFIPWMQVGKHKFPSYEDRPFIASAFLGESEFPTLFYAPYNKENARSVGLELKDRNCDWQIIRDYQEKGKFLPEATPEVEQTDQVNAEERKKQFTQELQSQLFDNPEVMPYYKECENDKENRETCSNRITFEFISKNIVYPELAKEQGIAGTVFLEYIVDRTGIIRDVKILRGVHQLLDDEAARVITKLPKMEPGTVHGLPVDVKITIPVKFRL